MPRLVLDEPTKGPRLILDEPAGKPSLVFESDEQEGLLKRYGKQFYNVALAAPAQAAGTKSPIGRVHTDLSALKSLEDDVRGRYERGEPLTAQEVEEYSKPYGRWSIGGLLGIDKPEWKQKLGADYQAGRLTIKEPETQAAKIGKLQEVLGQARAKTAKKADISFTVAEAENWKEKGVDVIAGITGFVAQLTVLKKAFPQAPQVFIWELQNQATGGAPGKGALTYGAFAAPGKIIKGASIAARGGRIVSESAILGGLTAAHQKIETGEINATDVLISAGIPLGLRAVGGAKGVLKRALKAKNPKAIKAVNEVISKKVDIPAVVRKPAVPKTIEEFSVAISKGIAKPSGKAKSLNLKDQWDYFSNLSPKEKLNRLSPVISKKVVMARPAAGETLGATRRGVPIREGVVNVESANKQILDWSNKAKLLNATERKASVHKLHQIQSARYAKSKEMALKGGASHKEAHAIASKARGGKAEIPQMKSLELSEAQYNAYGKRIDAVYPLRTKALTNAAAHDVLRGMTTGKLPGNYEIGLLEPVLGTEATIKLHTALRSGKGLELWDVPKLVRDIPKALRFGFDPQAARGLSKITFRHPLIYLSAVGKNIKGIFSKKYTDRIAAEIEASPLHKLAVEKYGVNKLSMKPWASTREGTRLEQYGNVSNILLRSNNRVIKGIGVWLRASERGANLGMNDAFNKLVRKGEKDLANYNRRKNLSDRDIATWRKKRGRDINILTKRIQAKHPKGREVQEAANWIVFSPAYTASGIISAPYSVGKLLTGKGVAGRTYASQIMLSRLAGLTAVSTAVGYAGHKWRLKNPTEEPPLDSSPNPLNPLFGKIREGEDVYDLGFGDVAEYRLLARIGVSAHLATKKAMMGKEDTTVLGRKVPPAGESFSRYLESKRTLYLSLGKQLLTGKDWLGRPVTLKDTALDNLPFEFFQAFVEAGEADGLWAEIASGMDLDDAKKTLGNLAPAVAALGGVGTASYPVRTTATRSDFRNIVAKKKYNKRWDSLTPKEQRSLSREYKEQFAAFERQKKIEWVKSPYVPEREIEESRKSNIKITKMLSESNQEKVIGVSLGVSRRPKNFFLNDERYQRYQELVAQHLNTRLSKVKLEGKSDKVRDKMLEIAVRLAKNKAFRDLRREMK